MSSERRDPTMEVVLEEIEEAHVRDEAPDPRGLDQDLDALLEAPAAPGAGASSSAVSLPPSLPKPALPKPTPSSLPRRATSRAFPAQPATPPRERAPNAATEPPRTDATHAGLEEALDRASRASEPGRRARALCDAAVIAEE
jgi:hypothetical protein